MTTGMKIGIGLGIVTIAIVAYKMYNKNKTHSADGDNRMNPNWMQDATNKKNDSNWQNDTFNAAGNKYGTTVRNLIASGKLYRDNKGVLRNSRGNGRVPE